MKKKRQKICLAMVVIAILVMAGCATSAKKPTMHEELGKSKAKPMYLMQGNLGSVEVIHRAVIVFRGKEPQPLDWANQNTLKGSDEIEVLRMEFEVRIEDPKIAHVFIRRVLNGSPSEWSPIVPLKKSNVFWVKLPTEDSEQTEAFVQLRVESESTDSKLIRTKSLKYKLER